ncbi:pentapeptide repeat-containing protein [Pantoea trifolii]|uniref:Pentapeptide repeat-containing protein n=1 Tax=Pantoea trifolii TaxID=2968030 RepID=A0ABT1VRA8_9GAMM|nr:MULTISPECIES: pentapeptide repeat-containing protein [unclassified Pantoea]MCQ8229099.1 pentapeptide repeat-containing protein [Pantoea sp. MMK2]MCQ8237273.1 pentapeptide repeat-containing protein [Pantoea sp. MMK3]
MPDAKKPSFDKIKSHPYASIFLVFSIYLIITIIFSSLFPWLSKHILPNTSLGIYNKDFWINLLINLNASLIDFIFFGIALFIFQRRNERKTLIEETKNSLSDISKYNDVTLNLKKVGLIRRLNEQKCHTITMHRLNISGSGVEMRDVKLIDSDLTGLESESIYFNTVYFEKCNLKSSNFQRSKLRNLTMLDCTLKNVNFSHSNLKGAIFKECRLMGAKFNNCNLQSAILSGSNLERVDFEGANLNFCNLKSAININATELCKAATLNYIVLDPIVELQVRSLRGDVKFSR